MASERESATARAHCGVHLRVTGIASTHPRSLRRWRTRRCRVCIHVFGIMMTPIIRHVGMSHRASSGDGHHIDVTSAPVRRIGTVTDIFGSKGDTCVTRARRGTRYARRVHDSRPSTAAATRRPAPTDRAATLTALAKKPSDGKLLPMRYISSSSASMHLRCRLMTSRKKA